MSDSDADAIVTSHCLGAIAVAVRDGLWPRGEW
jgi:hypothetical protein